jgi:hypothetical protein
MAQVTSPHIWYPAGYPGTAYDLRKIVAWSPAQNPANVRVRFIGDPVPIVEFVATAFETQKQASIDAGG